MTVEIEVVEERIRRVVPDVSITKLQNLLYLCQGHYVGRFLAPLFENDIWAVPTGAETRPRSVTYGGDLRSELSEGEARTIDEVLHQYGQLAESELTAAVCSTWPWQEATEGGWTISPEVIRDHFGGTLPDSDMRP
ncbi:hypothetical protein ACWEOO_38305 [Kribbella sp. NPDC004138]